MDYVKVIWHMSLKDYETDPIEIYYEVEDFKLVRGFELFINGSYQILPVGVDIPTIEHMNDQADTFTAFEITRVEFEFHWRKANQYSRWRFLVPNLKNVFLMVVLFFISLTFKIFLTATSKITYDFYRGIPFPFLTLYGEHCQISWLLCGFEKVVSVSIWMFVLDIVFWYFVSSLVIREIFPFLQKVLKQRESK